MKLKNQLLWVVSLSFLFVGYGYAESGSANPESDPVKPHALTLTQDSFNGVKIDNCDNESLKETYDRYPTPSPKEILMAHLLVTQSKQNFSNTVFLGRDKTSGERMYHTKDGLIPGGKGLCADDMNPVCVLPLRDDMLPVKCLWQKRKPLFPVKPARFPAR